MVSTLLRGARRFEEPGGEALDILLVGEQIASVSPAGDAKPEAGTTIIDASGLLALPGLIDTHVHPIHDETFASVGNAAVFGGITTIGNHLYLDAGEDYAQAITRMQEQGAGGTADFIAHLRWDRDQDPANLAAAVEAGARTIKIFMAYPDKRIQAGIADVVTVMRQASAIGVPVAVHAELGEAADRLLELGYADRSSLSGMNSWRTPEIEAAAITVAAAVAKSTGAAMYVVHVSSEQALQACLRARDNGVTVLVETCPHYLFLSHEEAPPGGQGFVLPPLRTESDKLALRQAIIDGLITTLGSDHCGYRDEFKIPTDIVGSKAGLPGIETMVPLMVDAVLGSDAWLPANRLVELLSSSPADALGISGKGALAPGYDADVVLIDPASTTTVAREHLHDASSFSPYLGAELTGAIRHVWRRGELVVADGKAVASGGGRLVRPAS